MKTKIYFLLSFFLVLFFAKESGAQCSAAFTHTVNGATVSFVPTTPPLAGQYNWDFGDSSPSGYGQNETHTYTNAGTYNVCLIVIDSLMPCTDTFCTNVTVAVGCNNLVVTATAIDASTCSACDGVAATSVSGGSAPYAYMWSNAATTSNLTNLCVGSYQVIVTDVNGCTANATANVNCPFSCSAGFNSYVVSGNTAYFNNTSNDTANSTFQWDFGDLTTSSSANDYHTYASAGTYTVTLVMVSTLYSCTDTVTNTITVGGPSSCYSAFNMQQDSFNLLQWYIYPTITGLAPFTYLWDFGDLTTSTLPNPNHTYAAPGQYTICLTVTDANSCVSYFCDSSSVQRSTASLQMQFATVINGPTGIVEQEAFAATIFPSPAGEILNVNFNQLSVGTIRLTDMTGKIVYEQSFSGKAASIDVSNFSQGIYNFNFSGTSGNWNQKVVVIH